MNNVKKIEENNRMGKTRDLFKKPRDTKGIFHAKMGTIKDRNCIDLIEAEGIKKRWQEYAEVHKKGFNNSDNHNFFLFEMALITNLLYNIMNLHQ